MSWIRHVGAAVGVGAVVLTAVGVFAPNQLTQYVSPTAAEMLTQQPVQLAIAALLAVYAGWVVSLRGWLSPIHEELGAPAGADSTRVDARTDADDERDRHPDRTAHDDTTTTSESLSVFGRDVLRFGSRADARADADAGVGTTALEAGTVSGPADGTDRPGDSTVTSIPPGEFEALRSAPPERPQPGAGSVIGSDFDETVNEAIRSYGRRDDPLAVFDAATERTERSTPAVRPEEEVRARIVSLAGTIEESGDGDGGGGGGGEPTVSFDERATDAAVRSFLTPETPDSLGVLDRVRAWLVPESTFERVVERCLDALEDGAEGGRNRR